MGGHERARARGTTDVRRCRGIGRAWGRSAERRRWWSGDRRARARGWIDRRKRHDNWLSPQRYTQEQLRDDSMSASGRRQTRRPVRGSRDASGHGTLFLMSKISAVLVRSMDTLQDSIIMRSTRIMLGYRYLGPWQVKRVVVWDEES